MNHSYLEWDDIVLANILGRNKKAKTSETTEKDNGKYTDYSYIASIVNYWEIR